MIFNHNKDIIARNEAIIASLRKHTEEICNDPVKAMKYIRELMGPDKREIVGEEADNIMLILLLIGPSKIYDSFHATTYEYFHAGKTYHVIRQFGVSNDVFFLEEVLPEGTGTI